MKRYISLFVALVTMAAWPSLTTAQSGEVRGFAKLRQLVGEWDGADDKGAAVRASFRLIAGDSALLEVDTFADSSTTATVYHADMKRVALTHFSRANNQPRMSADPAAGDPQELDFSFVGATNLHSTQIGHMHHLLLRFKDDHHFDAVWTWRHYDQEQTETYHFIRKD